MHRAARTNLARALGDDASLPIGLLLGERATLDRALNDAVRRLGIVHLLALSGMHLTMVAAIALLVARAIPRRRDALVMIALSLYVGMVGDIDSLTRAYLMAVWVVAARALVRVARPMDALAMALFVMLLVRPTAALSVGLQLSFVATLAVLVCVERVPPAFGATMGRVRRVLLRSVLFALVIGIVVEVFIAPFQLHYFGHASMVGPLATVTFVVPVSLLQVLALVASWSPPGIGGVLAEALRWTSAVTRDAIVVASSHAPAPVSLPEPNWWLYYAGIWAACARPRRGLAWLAAVAAIGAAFLVGAR
jgi:competence protein ComEC